jgi:hypothetical protein
VGSAQQPEKLPLVPESAPNQAVCAALSQQILQEASMFDLRLVATTLAMMFALMSVSLAAAVKDKSPASEKAQPITEGPTEVRPIRVILPASWEPSKGQAEAQSTK